MKGTKKQIEAIADYWNQRAQGYSLDNLKELEHDQQSWLNQIEQYVSLNKEMKILDLGCGPGFFSLLLTQVGFHVVGVDYSDEMLQAARMNAEQLNIDIQFMKMDAQALLFEDKQFDVIVTRNVTWNLENPQKGYQEMLRVLKSGGHLINFDGNHYYQYKDLNYDHHQHSEHSHMENIDVSVIDEIAKELDLSYQLRPYWDYDYLSTLGVALVEYKILKEENVNGQPVIRQFLVHAKKL